MLVCLHGGGYTHRYFTVPGASMVEAAHTAGFDVFAIDRPDYVNSRRLPAGDFVIQRNAPALCAAVDELIATHSPTTREVVIIGHSIGGAIAVLMAATQPAWLRGIAVSGVGVVPSAGNRNLRFMPPLRKVPVPGFAIFNKLFGPAGTYDPRLAKLSLKLGLEAPVRRELIEIGAWWPSYFPEAAAQVRVPVDAVLGEFDALWETDDHSVAAFGQPFHQSPRCASTRWVGTGHCIDHHLPGSHFQQHQLAFARTCVGQY